MHAYLLSDLLSEQLYEKNNSHPPVVFRSVFVNLVFSPYCSDSPFFGSFPTVPTTLQSCVAENADGSANSQTMARCALFGPANLNVFSALGSITTCSSVAKSSGIPKILAIFAILRLAGDSYGERKLPPNFFNVALAFSDSASSRFPSGRLHRTGIFYYAAHNCGTLRGLF